MENKNQETSKTPEPSKKIFGLDPIQAKVIAGGLVVLILVFVGLLLFSGDENKPKEFEGENNISNPSNLKPELFGWKNDRWYGYYISFKPPRDSENLDSNDYGNLNENINFEFPNGSASVFVYSKAAYSLSALKDFGMKKISKNWYKKETISGPYKITSLTGRTKNLTLAAQIVEAKSANNKYTKKIVKGITKDVREKNAKET